MNSLQAILLASLVFVAMVSATTLSRQEREQLHQDGLSLVREAMGCLERVRAGDKSSASACAVTTAKTACFQHGKGTTAATCPNLDRYIDQARVAMKLLAGKNTAPRRSLVGDPVLPGPQQVHLSLSPVTTAEVTVIWITVKSEQNGTVSYRQHGATTQWNSAPSVFSTYDAGVLPWVGGIHSAVMSGLLANTRYDYFVESSGYKSSTFTFSSRPADGDASASRQFAVVADMGTAIPVGFEVTDFIDQDNGPNKDQFSMTLHAGDVCYGGTGSTYEVEEVWDAWGDQTQKLAAVMPYQFAVGNHEHYYNYSSFRTRYNMNGDSCGGVHNFWYYMPYGNVFFVFMSTEHPYDAGSEQRVFLEKTLASIDRKKFPWVVLLGHRPMYNTDPSEMDAHQPGCQFQVEIEPLLLKYQVDLAIWGHMHMYERVYPVRSVGTQAYVDHSAISPDGHVYLRPNSTAHMVQATAGVFTDSTYVQPQPDWSAVRNNKWGYGRMTIYNATHMQYEFRDWESGTTNDYFWIVK